MEEGKDGEAMKGNLGPMCLDLILKQILKKKIRKKESVDGKGQGDEKTGHFLFSVLVLKTIYHYVRLWYKMLIKTPVTKMNIYTRR